MSPESCSQPDPEHEKLERFRPGVYLHYKGRLYEAMNLVRDADDGRLRVYYAGLELSGASEGPRHNVRDFDEFINDQVHQDGSECKHGEQLEQPGLCADNQPAVSRFTYLGPIYETWMLDAEVWKKA